MLTPSQKKHARFISIVEGSFATVWGAFTGGFGGNSYLVGFFLWIGASPFVMSIYSSLIPLASVIQPFSLMFARKFTSKKKFILSLVSISRPIFFLIALTYFLPPGMKVWVALLIFFFIEILTSVVGSPWQTWMSEIVDPPIRGRYFGIRNFITGLVAIPSLLAAGYLLDALGKGFWAFFVIFLIGSIFGVLDWYSLKLQDEESKLNVPMINSSAIFEVLKIKSPYRSYLITLSLWIFTMNLVGPYTTVLMIEVFKYDYAILGILTVVSTFAATIFQPIWGRLGDRYGNFKILKLTLTIQTLLTFGWVFAIPSMYYMIPFQMAIGIIATAGTGLISFNFLMEIVPNFGKTEAFSIYASVTNLASFVGNLISGLLFLTFESLKFNANLFVIDAYRIIFLIAAISSLWTLYLVLKIKR
ncbi:MFS transporter [Athalassotoga saccharophila]|uniref:MFS transporter n=1 Tax=Athalassotoga saccharophila TaxID=1441386 RepID=UPI00137AA425|nr:MFS transporter [Athalassotoga saccharophila]BBJ28132.1 major facilitator superfamily [Athalassotoga saccharophila]